MLRNRPAAHRTASPPGFDASDVPDPLGELVTFLVPGGEVWGDLTLPSNSLGTVVFAHGSGSGRTSPRNRWVATELANAGIAALLLDLLTPSEAEVDRSTRRYRFDIPRLSERLIAVADALATRAGTGGKPIGLYGASTGGAAALMAAAARPVTIRALVLRGARSDLAGPAVDRVAAPTLFLVGELDPAIQEVNRSTFDEMRSEKRLEVVRGASHLFEEPGTLEEVARRTREWFQKYFLSPSDRRGGT